MSVDICWRLGEGQPSDGERERERGCDQSKDVAVCGSNSLTVNNLGFIFAIKR